MGNLVKGVEHNRASWYRNTSINSTAMFLRFLFQVAAFGLFYTLVLMATFPFLIYFGKPRPWQKAAEFMMSFPIDSEKVGAFSFFGAISIFFLNGLIWGVVIIGVFRVGVLAKNILG